MKAAYRLVVLDIDGTLLNEQHQVSERVRKAIRDALALGVHVTLATGRRLWSVRPIVAELGIRLPVILYSGALIWDTATQAAIYKQTLPPELVRQAIATIQSYGAQVIAFPSPISDPEEHLIFGPEMYDDAIGRAYAEGRIRRVIRMCESDICALDDLLYLAVVSSEAQVEAIYTALRATGKYTLQPGVNNPVADPQWYAVNIYSGGVSKAGALVHLADLYRVPLDRTMAIGDGNNDLELINAAGLGVAMGNARQHLKEAADVVVSSNAADGVAEAIERYILQPATSEAAVESAIQASRKAGESTDRPDRV